MLFYHWQENFSSRFFTFSFSFRIFSTQFSSFYHQLFFFFFHRIYVVVLFHICYLFSSHFSSLFGYISWQQPLASTFGMVGWLKICWLISRFEFWAWIYFTFMYFHLYCIYGFVCIQGKWRVNPYWIERKKGIHTHIHNIKRGLIYIYIYTLQSTQTNCIRSIPYFCPDDYEYIGTGCME